MDQWQWLADLKTFFDPPHTKIRIGSRDFFGLMPLWLSLKRFNSHLYCVGQSESGKSKLLQSILCQLATKGHGCGLIDPHADLASDLLAQLASYPRDKPWLGDPQNRQRIVYLDPSRSDYIVPCNILKNTFCSPYQIAENVVESFRRVWPETLAEAPRFAQILRNAVVVLIANGLTLLELEPLLTNKEFRLRMLKQVQDPLVASFFVHQYDKWGREQPIFVSPVLNKISAFLFNPQVRLMLCANENWVELRKIMDRGTILIVNLGGFAEETQKLLGSLFLTSLEQAAFSRSDQTPAERRPFYCMIDEFPFFCSRDSTSLARILSECRKFRLHIGLAHQTITQLPGERIQGALENAKVRIVLKTGRATAEAIVKDMFMPDPKAIKHEVKDAQAQERTHPLFNPLFDQFEMFTQRIQRLRRRKVLVRLPDREKVYQLRTPTVPGSRMKALQLEAIKRELTKAVGKPSGEIEQEIVSRATQNGVPLYIEKPHSSLSRYADEQVWQ